MATYLLTWKPSPDSPFSTLVKYAAITAKGKPVKVRWSTGNRTNLDPYARLFMLKQGKGGTGIIASGFAASGVSRLPHWRTERRREGRKSNHVDGVWERFLNPETDELLSPKQFKSGPLTRLPWNVGCSGYEIPEGIAEQLEIEWEKHLRRIGATIAKGIVRVSAKLLLPTAGEIDEIEASYPPEGRPYYRLHRQRERISALVKAAKRIAKQKHGKLICELCDFDFVEQYGKRGEDFIEAHHTKFISARAKPTRTKLSEIALICSNCHRIIHRKYPWATMAEMRALLKATA